MRIHFWWCHVFQSVLLLAMVAQWGCGAEQSGPQVDPNAQVMVVTTDYQTGSYSTIEFGDHQVVANIQPIHPDAVCRFDAVLGQLFVVARMGADSLEWIDSQSTWMVRKELSTGSGSNPQDIAVFSEERAYIVRYNQDTILVINPVTGAEIATVDIGDYADADGIPEAAWVLAHQDKVYVILHRLANFVPTDYSSILVLAGNTGKIEKEIKLKSQNPFAKLRYCESLDRIVIGESGTFGVNDGGVELLDPANDSLTGFVVTEESLGGDINDVVIVSETKGYAVIGESQPDFSVKTRLVSFNPSTGKKIKDLVVGKGFDHAFMELSPDRLQLWVTDRNPTDPGIRIFATANDQPLTSQPIDVGLPPYMICFVQ